MMVYFVDLFYDLVDPHITFATIHFVAFVRSGAHIYQHRQKPISSDIAWHIQSGVGPG